MVVSTRKEKKRVMRRLSKIKMIVFPTKEVVKKPRPNINFFDADFKSDSKYEHNGKYIEVKDLK